MSNLEKKIKSWRCINEFLVFCLQALCGCVIEVPTLGTEKIPINLTSEIVRPTTTKRLQGHGLPHPKEASRKGDILVNFDIKFPDSLSQSAKDILYDTLPN